MKKLLLLLLCVPLIGLGQFSVGNDQTICLGDSSLVMAIVSGPASGCSGISDSLVTPLSGGNGSSGTTFNLINTSGSAYADPDVLIKLNVVPLDPFPPDNGVTRLSDIPLHPDAGPETIAITKELSPKQIVWSLPTENCPKPIKGTHSNSSNSFFILFFVQ